MKKISVIGCPGIGTDGFGKKLSEYTGIPYHHISEAYAVDEADLIKNISFAEREEAMTREPSWIIDGGCGEASVETILKACDTVFFFDYPRKLCSDIVKANPDRRIPCGVVARFHMDSRGEILKVLEKYQEKNITVFKNEEDKERFLKSFFV